MITARTLRVYIITDMLVAVDNGAYFGFGFVLMFFGGIMEFFLGNTFPAVVFTSFSGFWFTFGGFLVPGFGSSE